MNTHSELFPLGQIVITLDALRCLDQSDACAALQRHANGDWGDLSLDDEDISDIALQSGGQLVSAFRDRNGRRFFIVTQSDRRQTTLFLPNDDWPFSVVTDFAPATINQ